MLGDDVPGGCISTPLSTRPLPEHAYLYSILQITMRTTSCATTGFHGTLHRYVTLRAAELLGKDPPRI